MFAEEFSFHKILFTFSYTLYLKLFRWPIHRFPQDNGKLSSTHALPLEGRSTLTTSTWWKLMWWKIPNTPWAYLLIMNWGLRWSACHHSCLCNVTTARHSRENAFGYILFIIPFPPLVQVASFPFEQSMSLIVVMPMSGQVNMSALAPKMNISSLYERLPKQKAVQVKVPKFKLEYSQELKEVFFKLGKTSSRWACDSERQITPWLKVKLYPMPFVLCVRSGGAVYFSQPG